MKRLFNNRTIENTSSEKNLNQGRLANMRKLNLRRLFSLAGMAVLLGAMVFTVHGATIDGTDDSDVLSSGGSEDVIQALGGDDSITAEHDEVIVYAGPGDDNILYDGGTDVKLFGEDGNDTFRLNNADEAVTAKGGRGDDFFNVTAGNGLSDASVLIDGPGSDVIRQADSASATGFTVKLIADNEQDTVLLGDGDQTIQISKGSGRDVIDCGGAGTVFLNGNRKAQDTQGNNLRKAALLGGTAESGCDTIIP